MKEIVGAVLPKNELGTEVADENKHDSITTFASLRDDVYAELNHHEQVCLINYKI